MKSHDLKHLEKFQLVKITLKFHLEFNFNNFQEIKILTHNCPGPEFCLFLKFGQAIVVRVLMLKF